MWGAVVEMAGEHIDTSSGARVAKKSLLEIEKTFFLRFIARQPSMVNSHYAQFYGEFQLGRQNVI